MKKEEIPMEMVVEAKKRFPKEVPNSFEQEMAFRIGVVWACEQLIELKHADAALKILRPSDEMTALIRESETQG